MKSEINEQESYAGPSKIQQLSFDFCLNLATTTNTKHKKNGTKVTKRNDKSSTNDNDEEILDDKTKEAAKKYYKQYIANEHLKADATILHKPPEFNPNNLVHVIIDPCINKILKPYELDGVKFMYNWIVNGKKNDDDLGDVDDLNGCILADEVNIIISKLIFFPQILMKYIYFFFV